MQDRRGMIKDIIFKLIEYSFYMSNVVVAGKILHQLRELIKIKVVNELELRSLRQHIEAVFSSSSLCNFYENIKF